MIGYVHAALRSLQCNPNCAVPTMMHNISMHCPDHPYCGRQVVHQWMQRRAAALELHSDVLGQPEGCQSNSVANENSPVLFLHAVAASAITTNSISEIQHPLLNSNHTSYLKGKHNLVGHLQIMSIDVIVRNSLALADAA